MNRTIKVNQAELEVPTDATGAQIKKIARDAGIEPSKRGEGLVELRGYLPSGGAELIPDSKRPIAGLRIGRHTIEFTDFGLQEVSPSNVIGKGRSSYWPASEGRLNDKQIHAAVGDERIWPMKSVLRAPALLRSTGRFGFADWNIDETSQISQNAPGAQYDNYRTLSLDDGETLIELMKEHASEKRSDWDRQKKAKAEQKRVFAVRFAYLEKVGYDRMNREWWADRGKPHTDADRLRRDVDNQLLAKYSRQRRDFPGGVDEAPAPVEPEKTYQEARDAGDTRTIKLALLPRRGKFQRVDITRTLTPYGLRKLVVIYPDKLRVFWHPGQEQDVYEVAGVSVALTEHQTKRYYEGQPTAEQWEALGV